MPLQFNQYNLFSALFNELKKNLTKTFISRRFTIKVHVTKIKKKFQIDQS